MTPSTPLKLHTVTLSAHSSCRCTAHLLLVQGEKLCQPLSSHCHLLRYPVVGQERCRTSHRLSKLYTYIATLWTSGPAHAPVTISSQPPTPTTSTQCTTSNDAHIATGLNKQVAHGEMVLLPKVTELGGS